MAMSSVKDRNRSEGRLSMSSRVGINFSTRRSQFTKQNVISRIVGALICVMRIAGIAPDEAEFTPGADQGSRQRRPFSMIVTFALLAVIAIGFPMALDLAVTVP